MWRGAPKSALAVHSNYDNRVRPTCALFKVHTGTAQDHGQVKQTVDEMHERTRIEKTATETKEGLTWAGKSADLREVLAEGPAQQSRGQS